MAQTFPVHPRPRIHSPGRRRQDVATRPALDFVGRDVSRGPSVRQLVSREWLLPLAAGLLLSTLLLSVLRNAIIDVRLELGQAQQVQRQLGEEVRKWTVEARRLRHPARLRPLAAEMGLAPVQRVVLEGRSAEEPLR